MCLSISALIASVVFCKLSLLSDVVACLTEMIEKVFRICQRLLLPEKWSYFSVACDGNKVKKNLCNNRQPTVLSVLFTFHFLFTVWKVFILDAFGLAMQPTNIEMTYYVLHGVLKPFSLSHLAGTCLFYFYLYHFRYFECHG